MKVRIAPAAVREIAEIEAFIQLDNPEAARRLAKDIFDRCLALGHTPEQGTVIGRIRGLEIRRLVHGRYLIVYSISGDVVRIHRIRHGARSPRLLLKGLDPS